MLTGRIFVSLFTVVSTSAASTPPKSSAPPVSGVVGSVGSVGVVGVVGSVGVTGVMAFWCAGQISSLGSLGERAVQHLQQVLMVPGLDIVEQRPVPVQHRHLLHLVLGAVLGGNSFPRCSSPPACGRCRSPWEPYPPPPSQCGPGCPQILGAGIRGQQAAVEHTVTCVRPVQLSKALSSKSAWISRITCFHRRVSRCPYRRTAHRWTHSPSIPQRSSRG